MNARTPICAECRESIIFVPTSGFGQRGDWQHKVTPANPGHMARPYLFIDPPIAEPTASTTTRIPDGFLGC